MSLPQGSSSGESSRVPTPEEFPALYASGMSLSEIAAMVGRTQTFVRKRLLKGGTRLRSKSEGRDVHWQRHPEYVDKLYKWKVKDPGVITEAKLLLMTMIITEGCICRSSIHFTNAQELLHARFRELVHEAYGDIRVGRNNLNSRFSSVLITKDIAPHVRGKVFSQACLDLIISSRDLCAKVARIIADTEGSMIISVRRAPNNYTVEFRVVLACTNPGFSAQIKTLLESLGIESRINRVGVHILKKECFKRFVEVVGFTPGLKVIRKKAGLSVWYGCDKSTMTRVFRWISDEQDKAWGNPKRFLFANCKTREQTVERLMSIYRQVSGG
jgi:hypothetical protein